MNILDIIEKKKQGQELSKEDIYHFVSGYCAEEIKEYQAAALLMAICIKGMSKEETYHLTMAMVDSGDKIDYESHGIHNTIDKHSTGGVGDAATLVFVPTFMALGYSVGKMSGRGLGLTGGTLDKLASIHGYNTDLTIEQFISQIKSIGGALIGQTAKLCPADKNLYALRDATATVTSIPLIASSVMSKKIASGAKNIVIDVKCGQGALVKDCQSAVLLGDAMMDIGSRVGINISYIVTNMELPLGEYIGNALEVFGAIEVMKGEKNRLYEVVIALGEKLLTSMEVKDARAKLEEVIRDGKCLEKFRELVVTQGGDSQWIDNPYKLFTADSKMDVLAQRDGYITGVDAEEIARIVFDIGGGRINKDSEIDLSVGVRVMVGVGDKVLEGDTIATLYFNKYQHAANLKRLYKSISIGKTIKKYKLIIKE